MKIFYRINPMDDLSDCKVNQLQEEMPITGFFQMKFNNNYYGYYHDKPLQEGEEGLQSLSTWFNILTEAFCYIVNHDYVLVNDVESYKMLLLFERKNIDILRVSLVQCSDKSRIGLISTNKMIPIEYGRWSGEEIDLLSLRNELVGKGTMFINNLLDLNPCFIQIPIIAEIKSRIDLIVNS